MESIYGLTKNDLSLFLASHGRSKNLAVIIYETLYKKKSKQILSTETWNLLRNNYSFDLPVISVSSKANDGTYKFLIEFVDGKKVETVLIPFHKRYTICLSSQVGCAMKCSFCYTGTMGLTRHLKTSEIIGQYMVVKKFLETEIATAALIPNIVFMGQGEPLHNFDEVQKALEILLDSEGAALGPRQITLSTAGYLPGLKKFNLMPNINLALSLHSPFNQTRKDLIPITGQYPIEEIFSALDKVKLMKRQFITYEYLLIAEVNDGLKDADELQNLLGKRKSIINIIPFNPFPGSTYKRPTEESVENFKAMLVERKLRTMVRLTKGTEILAACGQLIS
ncbi:MAG: 23S rRNA (adenine(2503)-C(2))-methyltransferase RlmN [Bacteriovorax sp.]|jgi:23S rRNA (adenine2503-C2)-methyltransferase